MPTIDAVLHRAAEYAPARIAVREWGGRDVSYRRLDDWASAIAARLAAAGIGPDARVGVHLPNGADFVAAQFGAMRAGAVASLVNYRLLPNEAARQLELAQARAIVTTADRAAALRDAGVLRDALFLVSDGGPPVGESLADLFAAAGTSSTPPPDREEHDALARFTSGSTGAPKGVLVSHRAWLTRAVSILAEELKVDSGSTTMVLGPLSHQAGLFVLPTFMRNGTLLTFDRFDLAQTAAALSSLPVAQMQMVPTMLRMLVEDGAVAAALAASTLRQIVYGGSPIAESVIAAALDLLPNCDFVQGYGSHEAGAISHLDGPAHRDPARRRSAGRPFLLAEVRIAPFAGGDYGEIEVRAPWTPRARITERGREPVTEDWIPTGDLGEMRDGFLYLMDRAHDVIITGGFNVYPKEVETVLNAHPDVAMSAVVSMPDPKWGEKVIAFVVPAGGRAPDEAALREHCRHGLSNFKVPKEYRTIPEMPLNANGKPDRRRLSDPLWEGQARRIN
jgi:acyl-CoA synthetase (AMP-forming)/AMP-acid ligase II